jgi:hypothetical protein
MKLVTFVIIISFLLVMVLLTASSAGGSGRGSCSDPSLALKFRMIQ